VLASRSRVRTATIGALHDAQHSLHARHELVRSGAQFSLLRRARRPFGCAGARPATSGYVEEAAYRQVPGAALVTRTFASGSIVADRFRVARRAPRRVRATRRYRAAAFVGGVGKGSAPARPYTVLCGTSFLARRLFPLAAAALQKVLTGAARGLGIARLRRRRGARRSFAAQHGKRPEQADHWNQDAQSHVPPASTVPRSVQ
jgi:hypothetical protein